MPFGSSFAKTFSSFATTGHISIFNISGIVQVGEMYDDWCANIDSSVYIDSERLFWLHSAMIVTWLDMWILIGSRSAEFNFQFFKSQPGALQARTIQPRDSAGRALPGTYVLFSVTYNL
jgi:hypothetical protein